MSGLLRAGIALLGGAALVGVADLVARATGDDTRLTQVCVAIVVLGVGAAVFMAGTLHVGSGDASRAETSPPAPAEDSPDDGAASPRRLPRRCTSSTGDRFSPSRAGEYLGWRRYALTRRSPAFRPSSSCSSTPVSGGRTSAPDAPGHADRLGAQPAQATRRPLTRRTRGEHGDLETQVQARFRLQDGRSL